jgi:hypothetical protein
MHGLGVVPGSIVALVVAVSFAAGLNVYATVLTLGLLARMHWAVLPGGLESLANGWVIGACAVLYAGEFFADKIPGFDVIWNVLHTFVRIPVAGLLAYAATSHLSLEMQLVVTCLGAVVAAVAHGSKTAARVAVTPSPEPVSNIALSTAEDGIAVGLSWLAMRHPVAAGIAVFGVCLVALLGIWWGATRIRAAWRRRFGERRKSAGALRRIGS